MSLRDYLQRLEDNQHLVKISQPISKTYEIAAVLKQLEPAPVLFESVRESPFRVVGNLFCSKAAFADYFGLPVSANHPAAHPRHRKPLALPGSRAGSLPGSGRPAAGPGPAADPAPLRKRRRQLHLLRRGDRQTPALRAERRLPPLYAVFRDGRWRCASCARGTSIPSCAT